MAGQGYEAIHSDRQAFPWVKSQGEQSCRSGSQQWCRGGTAAVPKLGTVLQAASEQQHLLLPWPHCLPWPLAGLQTAWLRRQTLPSFLSAPLLISCLFCSRVTLDTITRQCEKHSGDKEGAVFVDGGAQFCIPAATTLPTKAWQVPLVLSQSETQDLPISLTHSLLFTSGMHVPRGLWTTCNNTCPVPGCAKLFVPCGIIMGLQVCNTHQFKFF